MPAAIPSRHWNIASNSVGNSRQADVESPRNEGSDDKTPSQRCASSGSWWTRAPIRSAPSQRRPSPGRCPTQGVPTGLVGSLRGPAVPALLHPVPAGAGAAAPGPLSGWNSDVRDPRPSEARLDRRRRHSFCCPGRPTTPVESVGRLAPRRFRVERPAGEPGDRSVKNLLVGPMPARSRPRIVWRQARVTYGPMPNAGPTARWWHPNLRRRASCGPGIDRGGRAARASEDDNVTVVAGPPATTVRLGAPPALPLLEVAEVRQLRYDVDDRPFLVLFETTRACDLACAHCRAEAQSACDPDELSTAVT